MRAWALAAVLGLTACGLSRPPVDYGDAGLGIAPLSPLQHGEPFKPALVAFPYGTPMAVDSDHAFLYALEPNELMLSQTYAVGDGGAWDPLGVRTGPAGNSYLFTGSGTVYLLDPDNGGASVFAALGAAPVAFAAWRAVGGGVVWAPTPETASALDGDGADAGQFEAPAGYAISALAPDANGSVYAGLVSDGGCSGLAALGGDAGVLAQAFGSGPCVMALSGNNEVLWLAAGGDGGAALYEILARSLPDPSAVEAEYAVPNLTPIQLVVHSDTTGNALRLGVRGEQPGATIGLAQVSALEAGFAFQTISANEITAPTDIAFDEDGHLYVSDPPGSRIVVVY